MAEVKWDYQKSMGFFFSSFSPRNGWCVALWCDHPLNEGEDWREDLLACIPSSMVSFKVPLKEEDTYEKGIGYLEF